ncbi:MAG TPA: ATP-dependent sacrificial sulfur transferase LarE, partial [Gemmatimonadaceae bacterium]|nr:ATP-dependent sacrificial sulfur transferase LarE [Gemmatimonadaceae bacterium]
RSAIPMASTRHREVSEVELERKLLDAVSSAARDRVAYVCFSGGIDSTIVLAASVRAGVDTIALLGVSPSLAASERDDAHRIAAELGARVEEVETNEMDLAGYRNNAGDRCYYCKSALYDTVQALAATRNSDEVIFVGTHVDDLGEHRPGLQAAMERGVIAPLVDAGFSKADVRALARQWNLSNAEKPAAPCLASRVPVGTEVTPERLAQIETVEEFLRLNDIWPARARWHEGIVRLEIPIEMFERVVTDPLRGELRRACRRAGFKFVALDLGGLQSGSLSLPLVGS